MLRLLAYSGAKILVFGGYGSQIGSDTMYIPDTLYVLDVPTMTWSLGAKYQPRLGMVCSVSGDYLVVWGGIGTTDTFVARLGGLNQRASWFYSWLLTFCFPQLHLVPAIV